MNFLELKNRVKARLNWSSADATALVEDYLNERYRQVASAVNLEKVRFGTVTANTAIGNNTLTFSGVSKLHIVYDTVILKAPLAETTVDDIRERDAAAATSGTPTHYAIFTHLADSVQLLLFPKPTAISALAADGLLAGTDMSADGDEPAFPDDYHDVLIYGAEADGRAKMEKLQSAAYSERQFKERLSELKYFIVKSAYLSQSPRDRFALQRRRSAWPYVIGA